MRHKRSKITRGGGNCEEAHPEGTRLGSSREDKKDLTTNMVNRLRAITSLTVIKRKLRLQQGRSERLDC